MYYKNSNVKAQFYKMINLHIDNICQPVCEGYNSNYTLHFVISDFFKKKKSFPKLTITFNKENKSPDKIVHEIRECDSKIQKLLISKVVSLTFAKKEQKDRHTFQN